MRNFLLIFCFIGILLVSCTKEYDYDVSVVQKERDYIPSPTRTDILDDNGDLMVFGPKLTNPYTVVNMQQARLQALSKHPDLTIPAITLTHYYVKFKPRNDEELKSLLQDTTLYFYDYPLDREIISGSYYHDPAVADSLPTYQYVSVPASKWSTLLSSTTSPYEILAALHIPDEDKITSGWGGGTITPVVPDLPQFPDDPFDPADSVGSGGGFPWIPKPPTDPGDEIDPNNNTSGTMSTSSTDYVDILVDEAMALAGYNDNQTMYPNEAAGSKWRPAGTITAYDDIVDGPVPLEGVKVRARRWFTTHTGITDAEGNFSCDGRFRRPANYSIIWERAYWDIRSGYIGQAYYDGPKQKGDWELYIGKNEGSSLGYATVHRAAFRTFYGNNLGLLRPIANKEKIGYFHRSGSVTADYWLEFGLGILPDIRIFGFSPNNGTLYPVSRLLSSTYHELGHAAHWTNSVGNYIDAGLTGDLSFIESWADCVQYVLTTKEYEDLGVVDSLHQSIIFDLYLHSVITTKPNDINRQYWSANDDSYYARTYTPFFIDLIDMCNQKIYFNHASHGENDEYVAGVPDDNVSFSLECIEDKVMRSASFRGVRNLILQEETDTLELQNFSILFSYYE